MSGGVDSSVAAALLVQRGYDMVGMTMHLWSDPHGRELALNRESGCCSVSMARDAAAVAERMGFRHYVVDLSEEFHRHVVEDFAREYLRGRTPNPCVRCNTLVKWQALFHRARLFGCEYFATGHYARIESNGDRYRLLRARHVEKDQSYALWGITQADLGHTIFPLGELSKPEVRRLASELGLPNASRAESQEICFVPDDDYRRFLSDNFPRESSRLGAGDIVDPGGVVLGHHEGVARFTVGQRKGLGIAAPRPLYVTRIDTSANRVHVDYEDGCFATSASAEDVNWVSIAEPHDAISCEVKVRYRDEPHPARVVPKQNGRVQVELEKPVRAVTPGQSAVFYSGDVLLGGGVICDMEERRH